jgi:DNA-binding winged helix-turn-helix (wHTH) protein
MRSSKFVLGSYRIDLNTGLVEGPESSERLSYRAREALRMLIAAEGSLVRREELFEKLWPDQRVDETSLTKCIAQVRGALGNGGEGAGLVETVPRLGYRLRVRAEPLEEAEPDAAEAKPPPPGRRHLVWIAAGCVAIALAGFGWKLRQEWARTAEAERLFTEAERLSRRQDAESTAAAIRTLERAIALEPERAAWYAHLSQFINKASSAPIDGKQALTALEAARKGVELDPGCLACQVSYGFFLFYHQWAWGESEKHLRIADRLAPGNPDVGANLAMLLAAQGRLAEAETRMEKAIAQRPYRATWHAVRASILYFLGRYEKAVAAAEKGISLDRRNLACWDWKSRASWEMGRREQSVLAMAEGPYVEQQARVEQALAQGGAEAGWRELLRITEGAGGRKKWMWRRAVWRMYLGERAGALEELEFGVALRNVNMAWIAVDPAFRELRGEARFAGILREMGLKLGEGAVARGVPTP